VSLHLARDFGEQDGLTQNPTGHVLDDGRERLAALKHADHRPAAITDGRGDFVEFDAITFDLDLKIDSFLEEDMSVTPLGPIAGKIGAFGTEIASAYGNALASVPFVRPLMAKPDRAHAYHLYVVELDVEELGFDRAEALKRLRTAGIGVNIHYGPVHLMSYYRERFGYGRGLCPIAERMSERILTLPIYPGMSDSDQARVIEAVSGLRA
jgi:hypothetical protein